MVAEGVIYEKHDEENNCRDSNEKERWSDSLFGGGICSRNSIGWGMVRLFR